MKRHCARIAALLAASSLALLLCACQGVQSSQQQEEPELNSGGQALLDHELALAWSGSYAEEGTSFTLCSSLLQLGNAVYLACESYSADYAPLGARLIAYDSEGQVLGTCALPGDLEYSCGLAAEDGKIYVPLAGGQIAVCTQSDMSLCAQYSIAPEQQLYAKTLAVDGKLYLSSMVLDQNYNAASGSLFCLDAASGQILWRYDNPQGGYYWSSPLLMSGMIYIAGDDGRLLVLDAASGELKSAFDLGAPVRSAIVADGTRLLMNSYDGVLHAVSLDSAGLPVSQSCVAFAQSACSRPLLYEGGIVCAGGSVDEAGEYRGKAVLIKSSSLEIIKSLSLPAAVQSDPCLLPDGAPCCTVNGLPGTVFLLDFDTQALMLFEPEAALQNYCCCSPLCLGDSLIFNNDSGTLFALR